MDKAKHTPGPWQSCPHPADDRERFSHWVCEENDPGHNIGICLCETRPDSEANACLIAAAPDMLAALQRAIWFDHPSEMEEPGGLFHDIRAAIAKATGGRP